MDSRQAPPGDGIVSPSSIETVRSRVPLYSEKFAADPHAAYRQMRSRYGSMAPVEIWPEVPATLVLGYRTAVRILNDPEHFPADPRAWQKNVPKDLPILPMVEWRPNALRSTGADHARYRAATNDALAGIDLYALHTTVEEIAIPLVDAFSADGAADVISQYVLPLVFTVLNTMLGCPAHIGQRVALASAQMFEGLDTDEVNTMLNEALLELTRLKQARPGNDITSRLVNHPAELSDEEMIHQLVTCYAAGIEPLQNLITNTLLLILTDPRFTNGHQRFALPTSAALDETLATDPPLANYCLTYPRHPILIDGIWLPANEPVITSMAACSNDPAMNTGEYSGNGWNLGWGTGPHACPKHGRSVAYQIARDAIDQLLDLLPEIRLAVPAGDLVWRPGAFHRALTVLPVVFSQSPLIDHR
ncbi:cytochrome P450 [Nocardia colli]|uniref:cytochrome P450 n=1 Tax=Nocardia colli TaxID=2545717 RepID=UPI0035D9BFC1